MIKHNIGDEIYAYIIPSGGIPRKITNEIAKKGMKQPAGVKKHVESKVAKEASILNELPNVQNAKIDPRKLTEYALNLNHPVGGNKAKVFESVLGYNKSNADALMKQVQQKLPQSQAEG